MRMGYPIFQEEVGSEKLVRRVFFEYSDKASVTVNLNHNLAAIVFDHLVPEQANLEGMFDYYIPDMTYDGYSWSDGIWNYKEDIIAYNDENKKTKQFVPGKNGEEDEVVEMKDVWIDPVDENGPIDNQGHDATAPIEVVEEGNVPTDVDATIVEEKQKRGLFGWRSKTHSAIGDRKAEKKQDKRGRG